jgi:predicted transcriptional regulator
VSSVGRPKLDPAMRREIAKRLAAGDTAYRIAKDMGISAHTVAKYAEE